MGRLFGRKKKKPGVTSVDVKETLHILCGQFQRQRFKVERSIKIGARAD
jgi:hypothetical protein